MASTTSLIFLVLSILLLSKTDGQKFFFGGEASRICESYKLICPAKKVCALQSIEWPRAMKFPVCVHEKHIIVKSNICKRAPLPGKCGARFVRWYFNVHMGACSWFTYSGCGGNSNNFRTAEECEKRCMSPDNGNMIAGQPDRMKGINTILLEDEASNQTNIGETDKTIKLLTAPTLEADDKDATASLQADQRENDLAIKRALRKERRRQRRLRKEKKRRRMRKKKMRMNRVNLTTYQKPRIVQVVTRSPVKSFNLRKVSRVKPIRSLSLSELGPNYNNRNKNTELAELTGRETSHSGFGRPRANQWQQEWLMDRRFRSTNGRRRRRRRRHHHHGKNTHTHSLRKSTPTPINIKDTPVSSYSKVAPTPRYGKITRISTYGKYVNDQKPQSTAGAHQDSYYDKVGLFDILETVSVPQKENNLIRGL